MPILFWNKTSIIWNIYNYFIKLSENHSFISYIDSWFLHQKVHFQWFNYLTKFLPFNNLLFPMCWVLWLELVTEHWINRIIYSLVITKSGVYLKRFIKQMIWRWMWWFIHAIPAPTWLRQGSTKIWRPAGATE